MPSKTLHPTVFIMKHLNPKLLQDTLKSFKHSKTKLRIDAYADFIPAIPNLWVITPLGAIPHFPRSSKQ